MPIADKIMNTKIMHYYKKIKIMQKWSLKEIGEWQNKKLRSLIKHAYNNTLYYKELFDREGIEPDDICTVEDLLKLPILKKKDIINNFNKLISKNLRSIPHIKSSTGGSTGDPVKFYLDKDSWSFFTANTIVNWEKTGYKYGDKYLALGSTSIFVDKKMSIKHKTYYQLKNKIPVSGINMSNNVCAKYVDLIMPKNIKYIYGYASSIYLLAKYIIDHDITVSVNTCFPTSEILLDHYRQAIETAFHCKIMDNYGARDGGITAFEFQKGFYEIGYNAIITLKNKDVNNIGTTLLTDLLNYAMPLINYQLGDEHQIDEEKNKDYFYNGQIFNKIIGRTSDVIRLGNGQILTGPGFTILFKDLPVEFYSIIQKSENEIECLVKKLPAYTSDDERTILTSLQNQAGDSCKIRIRYVEKFDVLASGKRRYFIN